MGVQSLSLEAMREMLLRVCEAMEASQDLLTQADKAIGDGDHGVGMARGFAEARHRLEGAQPSNLAELLGLVGLALMTSVGGAAGIIFGMLFRGGADALGAAPAFGSAELAVFLSGGLQGVQSRGKARPGDKTVVDALEPAGHRAQELVAAPLDEALLQVVEAAEQGAEATKAMLARVGKARSLGERSLGYADPGALSFCLILRAMADFVCTRRET